MKDFYMLILYLGGIVSNSDYGRRPHCFDTCHIFGGSLQRPSGFVILIIIK